MPGRADPAPERVFIGLGGNVGEPAQAIAEALALLDATPGIRVGAVSSLYRTPPWGKLDQPDFINAAAELETRLEPQALLATCLAVERQLKRERKERWGPRTIDIDIIAYGERRIHAHGLELPHPRFAERAFVLVPLAEIAGDHRIGGTRIADLAARLDASGITRMGKAGN